MNNQMGNLELYFTHMKKSEIIAYVRQRLIMNIYYNNTNLYTFIIIIFTLLSF
jgi:hypothetical protein